MKRRTIAIAAAFVALAGGAFVLWQGKPLPVTTARAHIGPATELVYATGYVEAQQPVTISSRITAPVQRVLVSEGDAVHPGQPLILLAADEQQAALAQAQAQQRAAQQTESRTLALFKDGWVTKAARDQAVATADAARAATAAATARQNQLVIRAASTGVVTRRDVYEGDLATPGKPLLLLGDPTRIRITATVDERDIARVRVGQPALMANDAWPGKAIPAHVSEVTPGGDPTARAFRVRLLPDATAGNLPIGLSLEVNLVTRREPGALLVPAKALTGTTIWTVDEGKAHPHTVTTGITGADEVQITSGLAPNAEVILSPPADLKDGQRVKASQ